MKNLLMLAALLGFAFAAPANAYFATADNTVYGQEDCKEGEKWNEDTQKCEPGQ